LSGDHAMALQGSRDPARLSIQLAVAQGAGVVEHRWPVRGCRGLGAQACVDGLGGHTALQAGLRAVASRDVQPYSTRLVTRNSIDRGKVIPSSRAVFMLTTRSKRLGCSTGRSAGLVPFRTLAT